MTSGSPWRWDRVTATRRRRLECWTVMNSIIPLFPMPRRLHRPNLCQGPGIAPCLWKNPLGMQIRSEFNLNSPNSLRIRSQREFAANSA